MAFIAASCWAISPVDKLGNEPSAIPKTTPPGPLTEAVCLCVDGLGFVVFLAVAGTVAMAIGAATTRGPGGPAVCGTVPRVGLGPLSAGAPDAQAVSTITPRVSRPNFESSNPREGRRNIRLTLTLARMINVWACNCRVTSRIRLVASCVALATSSVLRKSSVTLSVPLPRWRNVYLPVRTCSANAKKPPDPEQHPHLTWPAPTSVGRSVPTGGWRPRTRPANRGSRTPRP
jgi:hypothetical protein